jgi:hypothetical protein
MIVIDISITLAPDSHRYFDQFDAHLSHLISEEKPSASHMCVRIKLHTYDRQKSVISLTVFKHITEFNHLLHSCMRHKGL